MLRPSGAFHKLISVLAALFHDIRSFKRVTRTSYLQSLKRFTNTVTVNLFGLSKFHTFYVFSEVEKFPLTHASLGIYDSE